MHSTFVFLCALRLCVRFSGDIHAGTFLDRSATGAVARPDPAPPTTRRWRAGHRDGFSGTGGRGRERIQRWRGGREPPSGSEQEDNERQIEQARHSIEACFKVEQDAANREYSQARGQILEREEAEKETAQTTYQEACWTTGAVLDGAKGEAEQELRENKTRLTNRLANLHEIQKQARALLEEWKQPFKEMEAASRRFCARRTPARCRPNFQSVWSKRNVCSNSYNNWSLRAPTRTSFLRHRVVRLACVDSAAGLSGGGGLAAWMSICKSSVWPASSPAV